MSRPVKTELLISLNTDQLEIAEITGFVLHTVYYCPKGENTPGDNRYAMLFVGKGDKPKFAPVKSLPSDKESLAMQVLRADFIKNDWFNCLDGNYQQLDLLNYDWKYEGDVLQPLC